MPRFFGRVKTYFLNRNEGFIVELGECDSLTKENVVSERDIYFRASDLRVADRRSILAKSTTGDIVEYERLGPDDQGRYQAIDVTGLCETRLPCEEGLIIFKRYHDIQREALRREGNRAIDQFIAGELPRKRGRYPKGKRSNKSKNTQSRKHEPNTDEIEDFQFKESDFEENEPSYE